MANIGAWKGVYDPMNLDSADRKVRAPPVHGILAFLLWRAAYWTRQTSIKNKLLIPLYWFKSMVFGRDISRF